MKKRVLLLGVMVITLLVSCVQPTSVSDTITLEKVDYRLLSGESLTVKYSKGGYKSDDISEAINRRAPIFNAILDTTDIILAIKKHDALYLNKTITITKTKLDELTLNYNKDADILIEWHYIDGILTVVEVKEVEFTITKVDYINSSGTSTTERYSSGLVFQPSLIKDLASKATIFEQIFNISDITLTHKAYDALYLNKTITITKADLDEFNSDYNTSSATDVTWSFENNIFILTED